MNRKIDNIFRNYYQIKKASLSLPARPQLPAEERAIACEAGKEGNREPGFSPAATRLINGGFAAAVAACALLIFSLPLHQAGQSRNKLAERMIETGMAANIDKGLLELGRFLNTIFTEEMK